MADTKACEFCGTEIVRPASAEARDWRERRFCNTSCASRARRKVWDQSKPCEYCGETMKREPKTTARDWNRRRFCNGSCKNGKRKDEASAPRTCMTCGKQFMRPDGYDASAWAIRKFCSPECLSAHKQTPVISIPAESTLRDLYEVQRLTTRQIGSQFGVTKTTVKRWLVASGISVRDKGRGLVNRGITPPTKEELIDLVHVQHKPYREIGPMFGADQSAVQHWLKKHGIDRPTIWDTRHGDNKPDLPDADTLRDLYDSGLSAEAIGNQCGSSRGAIFVLCQKHGIKRRQPGFRRDVEYRCKDGLLVLSIFEQRVGDWLIDHSIPFEYEPKIPFQAKWKADFLANGWFIEAWGVQGWESYDEKRRQKTAWYHQYELPLIGIIPSDFSRVKKSGLSKFEEMMRLCLGPAVYSPKASRLSATIRGKRVNRTGRPILICQSCRKEFVPARNTIYQGRTPKYCGKKCYYDDRFNRNPPEQGMLF